MRQTSFGSLPSRRWLLTVFASLALLSIPAVGSASGGTDRGLALDSASSAKMPVGVAVTRPVNPPCSSEGERANPHRQQACRRKARRLRKERRRRAEAHRNASENQLNAPTPNHVPHAARTDIPPSSRDDEAADDFESPEEPEGTIPRCDLVEGDCSIYSDQFWLLQARYAPFELETGVYPMPPGCMEAQAKGEPVGCAQVITYLYPDGTLGGQAWVVDPCAPRGWRFWVPDPPTC